MDSPDRRLSTSELVALVRAADPDRAVPCIQCVLEAGGCVRCAMRFVPVKPPIAYDASDKALQEVVQRLLPHAELDSLPFSKGNQPCICCFGILQETLLNQVALQAEEAVGKFSHGGEYKLVLSLPPACTYLRQRALERHLDNTLRSPALEASVDLRQGAKFSLGYYLDPVLKMRYNADSEFFINVGYTHTETEKEVSAVLGLDGYNRKRPRNRIARESFANWMDRDVAALKKAVASVGDTDFADIVGVPPSSPEHFASSEVKCNVIDVYICGSYLKFSRNVSQSPWRVEGESDEKWVKTSVEDLLVPAIKENLRCQDVVFTSAGREDVDVRMLGTGRPFVLRTSTSTIVPGNIDAQILTTIAQQIRTQAQGAINVTALRRENKSYVDHLKTIENSKMKSYLCVIWSDRTITADELQKLNAIDNLRVQQRTPLRVLHRRSQAVREKTIFKASVKRVSDHFLVATLEAEAGTYIKELVHGDFGRTKPSFASMLDSNVDITQLDVVEVRDVKRA